MVSVRFIYLENQKDEALDSAMVMSMPFQFMVRWIKSAASGKYYYRLFIDGSPMGLSSAGLLPIFHQENTLTLQGVVLQMKQTLIVKQERAMLY
jgi:hypothetical protein